MGDAKNNVKSVPLNDLWEFSLITAWQQILTTTTTKTEGEESEKSSRSKSYVPCAPTARGSHVAGRCGRFLLVFGGAARSVLKYGRALFPICGSVPMDKSRL